MWETLCAPRKKPEKGEVISHSSLPDLEATRKQEVKAKGVILTDTLAKRGRLMGRHLRKSSNQSLTYHLKILIQGTP